MPEGESLQGLLVALKGHLSHPTAAPRTKLIACTFSFLSCSADTHPIFSDWFFSRVQLVRLGPWVSGDIQALQVPRVNKAFLASLEKKGPR